jgi:hypothetical protein
MVAIRDFEMQPRTQAAAGFLALGECSRWLGYSCGARWQHRNTQFHSVVVIGFLSPRLDFPLPAYLPARLIVKMLPRAAEAYRAQVAKIRDVLQDENAVHRARVALRDMLDDPVKLSPSPEGKYLIAEIAYSPKSLLRAAGSDFVLTDTGPGNRRHGQKIGGREAGTDSRLPRRPKGSRRPPWIE